MGSPRKRSPTSMSIKQQLTRNQETQWLLLTVRGHCTRSRLRRIMRGCPCSTGTHRDRARIGLVGQLPTRGLSTFLGIRGMFLALRLRISMDNPLENRPHSLSSRTSRRIQALASHQSVRGSIVIRLKIAMTIQRKTLGD